MNVYNEIAVALTQVQAEQAAEQPMGACTVTYAQNTIPAYIGVFEQSQVLPTDGGPWMSVTAAILQITFANLPATTQFRSGAAISVISPSGVTRSCRIVSWHDKYSFWEIVVQDVV